MLSSRWQLHDVPDVEQECRIALDQALRRHNARLTPDDYDDALSFLLGEVWQLSERYDPARGASFSTYLGDVLPMRVVTYWRRRFGSTGHRKPPSGSVYTSEIEDTIGDLAGDPLDDPHHALGETRIDFAALSPSSRRLWDKLASGDVQIEYAEWIGASQKVMHKRMAQLRDDLRDQGYGHPADQTSDHEEHQAA